MAISDVMNERWIVCTPTSPVPPMKPQRRRSIEISEISSSSMFNTSSYYSDDVPPKHPKRRSSKSQDETLVSITSSIDCFSDEEHIMNENYNIDCHTNNIDILSYVVEVKWNQQADCFIGMEITFFTNTSTTSARR